MGITSWNRSVLGRNTCGRAGRGRLGVFPAGTAAAVAVHVRVGAASAGDHRDVQLVVEVLAPQKGRRAAITPAAARAPPISSRRVIRRSRVSLEILFFIVCSLVL